MKREIKQLKVSDVLHFRLLLFKQQKGICPICKKNIKSPVLDHSHKKRIHGTGLIRGVICRTCNVFLAKSENNSVRYAVSPKELPSVLRNMADYLEREHLPYIHPSEKEKEAKLTKHSYNKLKKVMDSMGRTKCPDYPVSGKLTIRLQKLFEFYDVKPEYYAKPKQE